MKVLPIACNSDNYAYLVTCDRTGAAAVIDASEAGPIVRVASYADVKPEAIWSTHHHADHTGANVEVARRLNIRETVGHVSGRERIPGLTRAVEDGDRWSLGALEVEAIHVPGHTLDAVAYFVRGRGNRLAVFTGDTLFHAGCGRLFEGTAAQMHASLQRLLDLGPMCSVFPGHEYTLQNLRFARTLEPDNEAVRGAMVEWQGHRGRNEPTVGTSLAREVDTNPFLRTSSRAIRERLGLDEGADAVTVLAAVREAKDSFR